MMENKEAYFNRAAITALRIGFLALLLVWSFLIVKPFIMPLLWSIIFAVALYPVFEKLSAVLGGKKKLASTVITLVALTILLVPTVLFVNSTVDSLQLLAAKMQAGTLVIPPPPEKVVQWPLIGKALHETWMLFSTNLEKALVQFAPQIKAMAPKVLSLAAGLGGTILLLIVSFIITGVLLLYAEPAEKAAKSIFATLVGAYGATFVGLSTATIRSVVQGVIGIAVVQAILGGLGILMIGIPGAGLWSLIILLLAVMQLPPLLVLGPLAVYAFGIADTTPAVIFTIWSLFVSMSDAFLKPLFLGRGVDVPMLAVLLGAIGGMIMSGFIGLFVGAVVLVIAYKVFKAILVEDILEEEAGEAPPAG